MARPKKQTVEYFPHSCIHGKTMFILEERYGNDGYSFWFKLLEILGKTEGHFIVVDGAQIEFLRSIIRRDDSFVIDICNLLSKLDAIDKELWNNARIIWCQNFVDGIRDVYTKNRHTEIPQRPEASNYANKISVEGITTQDNPASPPISTQSNPQSKVKESKVNKRKEKDTPFVLPDYIPPEIWKAYLAVRVKKRAAQTDFALRLIIEELEKIKKQHGHDPVEVLKKSIKSGWTDVYPLKEDGNGANNGRRNNNQGRPGIPEISQPPEWKGDPIPEISEEERQANIARARSLARSLGTGDPP